MRSIGRVAAPVLIAVLIAAGCSQTTNDRASSTAPVTQTLVSITAAPGVNPASLGLTDLEFRALRVGMNRFPVVGVQRW
jgi:predicted component of type VI protein secretion system